MVPRSRFPKARSSRLPQRMALSVCELTSSESLNSHRCGGKNETQLSPPSNHTSYRNLPINLSGRMQRAGVALVSLQRATHVESADQNGVIGSGESSGA